MRFTGSCLTIGKNTNIFTVKSRLNKRLNFFEYLLLSCTRRENTVKMKCERFFVSNKFNSVKNVNCSVGNENTAILICYSAFSQSKIIRAIIWSQFTSCTIKGFDSTIHSHTSFELLNHVEKLLPGLLIFVQI